MDLGTDILGGNRDSTSPRLTAGAVTFREPSREDSSARPGPLRSLRTVVLVLMPLTGGSPDRGTGGGSRRI